MAAQTETTPAKAATNPARDAKHLLDLLAETKTVATALTEIIEDHGDNLHKYIVQNLETLAEALVCVHQEGRYQVARISPVSNLLQGYDIATKAEREMEIVRPNRIRMSDSMWRAKEFVKSCKTGQMRSGSKPDVAKLPVHSEKRRSERTATITPEKDMEKPFPEIEKLLTGMPPNGDDRWTKQSLIEALNKLEGTGKSKQFMRKVAEIGHTKYKSWNGIYQMYAAWKKTKIVPGGRGRPNAMKLDEAQYVVKKTLKERNTKSNAFQLKDMEAAMESKKRKKAEEDGLESATVQCSVSTKTAKAAMVAMAISGSG